MFDACLYHFPENNITFFQNDYNFVGFVMKSCVNYSGVLNLPFREIPAIKVIEGIRYR